MNGMRIGTCALAHIVFLNIWRNMYHEGVFALERIINEQKHRLYSSIQHSSIFLQLASAAAYYTWAAVNTSIYSLHHKIIFFYAPLRACMASSVLSMMKSWRSVSR